MRREGSILIALREVEAGPGQWNAAFARAWGARTKHFDVNTTEWTAPQGVKAEDFNDYTGVDYTQDNMWVQGNLMSFGSPAKARSTPDDRENTFQSGSFVMNNGVMSNLKDWAKTMSVGFRRGSEVVSLSEGLDLRSYFSDPTQAVASFFNEIRSALKR